MNSKKTAHGLTITAVLIAVFIGAALTPARTYTSAPESSATINLAKVDFENRAIRSGLTMIDDNVIPLAETP